MRLISEERLQSMLVNLPFQPQFKRNLEFLEATAHLSERDWDELELLPVWNRGAQTGLLLIQPNELLYVIPFSIRKLSRTSEGNMGPVICSFCCTWQSGDDGAFLVYYPPHLNEGSSIGIYCCSDLKCSEHARLKTESAVKSQTNMLETLSIEKRVKRLKERLSGFIYDEKLIPTDI